MTVWEFDHYKLLLKPETATEERKQGHNDRSGFEPRLGKDGIKLGHLVGSPVRLLLQKVRFN